MPRQKLLASRLKEQGEKSLNITKEQNKDNPEYKESHFDLLSPNMTPV